MKIYKTITTSVDLLDSNDIYNPNKESMILNMLSHKFKNMCYESIYITEIRKILNMSSTVMVSNRLDGGAVVNVSFEVGGVILVKDEILHGCKIIEIQNNNVITLTYKFASIKLQKINNKYFDMLIKSLQVGNIISVTVLNSSYTPYSNNISVLAIPYLPQPTQEIYYQISQGLNKDEIEQLSYIYSEIQKEEETHAKLKTNSLYEFFRDIMYPYKNDQKYASNKAVRLGMSPINIDINEIIKLDNGIVIYPSEDDKINKRFFMSQKEETEKKLNDNSNIIVSSSCYVIMSDILSKYLLYLQSLRGFIETYHTREVVTQLLYYWKICKQARV
jgi:hypothetical protein